MKFLIAGFGSIGRRHFRNLLSLGIDDIVFFRSNQSTISDDEIADFLVETDLQSALSHKPDAVIIANPTSLHLDVAIQAAKQGCHLFIEKPISHSLERVDLLQKALQQGGGKVFTAFQFRFHPGLLTIKNLISTPSSVIGRPLYVRSHWGEHLPSWHPWEDYRSSYAARSEMGGGVVLTLSHPIDYLRWIFGEVVELTAKTGNRSDLELECEDFAEVQFTFRNGVTGSLHVDYYTKPKLHDMVIHCEGGSISWNYQTSGVVLVDEDEKQVIFSPPEGYERNRMYLDELAHFIDVCKNDKEPLCSYADGKQVLDICLGILQSGRYQERVIFEE